MRRKEQKEKERSGEERREVDACTTSQYMLLHNMQHYKKPTSTEYPILVAAYTLLVLCTSSNYSRMIA